MNYIYVWMYIWSVNARKLAHNLKPMVVVSELFSQSQIVIGRGKSLWPDKSRDGDRYINGSLIRLMLRHCYHIESIGSRTANAREFQVEDQDYIYLNINGKRHIKSRACFRVLPNSSWTSSECVLLFRLNSSNFVRCTWD